MDPRTFAELERAARGQAAEKPTSLPSIRPLQGLRPNQMGQSIVLNFGDRNVSIVEARTESDEAESIIVTAKQLEVTDAPVSALGHLIWGIGGTQYEADFDMINGVQFSVPANFIRVAGTYVPTILALPAPPTIQVFASLAYGSIAHHAQPPRLTQLFTRPGPLGDFPDIGPGVTSNNLPIPAFATNFTIQVAPFGAGGVFSPAQIEILDPTSAPIAVYTYTNNSNTAFQNEGTFPLPNQAAFLRITNAGMVDTVVYNAIFALCL